ncbi:nucleotidyltransferase domain-containing protein [Candidatus Woesearchaeota archaeon]|nr:nucleotidyltransferase domain-containing protein [Candidatus Woesearchaeota archaeon]
MIEKSTNQIVLSIFFENPTTEFYLRELSRRLKLSMPTIVSVTDMLAKDKLVIKIKGKALTIVRANRENITFIRYKRLYNLQQIYSSGIVDDLTERYNHPKAIVLFGSYARGDDTELSDIDIAVMTHKQLQLPLEDYQKQLHRPMSIHEIDLMKLSEEFKANLANGIVLEGFW